MDIASLVGLILGAVMVVFGILSSGGNIVDDFMHLLLLRLVVPWRVPWHPISWRILSAA